MVKKKNWIPWLFAGAIASVLLLKPSKSQKTNRHVIVRADDGALSLDDSRLTATKVQNVIDY